MNAQNDDQRRLAELRVSIQWIAECLLAEKRFRRQVVVSTLRCGREILLNADKCPIKWTATLKKIEELKPKVESLISFSEQKRNRLRVLSRNNLSKRSFYIRGASSTRIQSTDRKISPNNSSLIYIKLCKDLIFRILQSYQWRCNILNDSAIRCQRLFSSSTLRLCFLSILLSSLSDKYVDISSVYRADKFFSKSKCREVFRKLKQRIRFNVDEAKLAAQHFCRIRTYSTLALLSNYWKTGVLQRMYKSYLSKLIRAKTLLRVWLAWNAAVSLQPRESIARANLLCAGDSSLSSLKRNWSSIRHTMDHYLCCLSANFLEYSRSRIFLFPHSWRNTATKSNFQTLLNAFSKSSLSEILNTLANHQSVSKISSQWIPIYSVSNRMNQSDDCAQQTDSTTRVEKGISSHNKLDGQFEKPSHGSKFRPIARSVPWETECHSSLQSKHFSTDHSKSADTEFYDLNFESKDTDVHGRQENSANVLYSSTENRLDQLVKAPTGGRYDDKSSDFVKTVISTERKQNNIDSATKSLFGSVSKSIQISTPCKEVRTQTESHNTTASVQTVEDRTENRQDLYHLPAVSARSYNSIDLRDSGIQTEVPEGHVAVIALGKLEAAICRIDDQVPLYDHNPSSVQRVTKTDGSLKYSSLDGGVICSGEQHTMPAISRATIDDKATQTRSARKEVRTQTVFQSATTAMQTDREDQLKLEHPLQPQLVSLEVGSMKSISRSDEGELHTNTNREDTFRSDETKRESSPPPPAERIQIERPNDDNSMLRIVEDVQKSAQSIAAALEKIESLSHRHHLAQGVSFVAAECSSELETSNLFLLSSPSSSSSSSSMSSTSSSSSSSSSLFYPAFSGKFLNVPHGQHGGAAVDVDLYSQPVTLESTSTPQEPPVTSIVASGTKATSSSKFKTVGTKVSTIGASKDRWKAIDRHSHVNVSLSKKVRESQPLPQSSYRTNNRNLSPLVVALSNRNNQLEEDDGTISSSSSEDSDGFVGQRYEERNYFDEHSNEQQPSGSYSSAALDDQEIARSIQSMKFQRLIRSCRGFIRFLKRLSSFRRSKDLIENRRVRTVFLKWSETFIKIVRKLKLSENVYNFKLMRRFFSSWSRSRSSHRFRDKILQVYWNNRRAVIRVAFSSWSREMDLRRHLDTIVKQLQLCTKGRILREWRAVVRNDVRIRLAEITVRSNRIRHFFCCWRKKLDQKALLRRVFEYRDMAISFHRYNSPSVFQSLLSVLTAWAEYTRRQRLIRWSLAVEKKALFFRGVTLMARYFMQWADFHERFRAQERQRDRQVKMLSRQCFFNWKSYSREMKHLLTRKIRTKEFRLKCAVIDSWKRLVRHSLEDRPTLFRRRRVMEKFFKEWKLLRPLRLLLEPTRQAISAIRQTEKAFSCWRLLCMRRVRYRVGLTKLRKVFYTAKVRLCFLAYWPGSRSIRLASEYWGHIRKKGRGRIGIVDRSGPSNISNRDHPPEITGSDMRSFIAPRRESLFERAVRLGYLETVTKSIDHHAKEDKEQRGKEEVDDEFAVKLRLLLVTVLLQWHRIAGELRLQRNCARAVHEKANRRRLAASLRRWIYLTPLTKHRVVVWMEKPSLSKAVLGRAGSRRS